MTFQFTQLRKISTLLLITISPLTTAANEACTATPTPHDRSIYLSITQKALNNTEAWNIHGAFIVNQTPEKTFLAAKKFERLQQIIPLINIFELSEDRKQLRSGIKLLPGLSFQQVFKIDVTENPPIINLHFTEGSFAGLTGRICFLTHHQHKTAVVLSTTGNLANNPVPFFITNSILESLSKSVLKRWRRQIERSE